MREGYRSRAAYKLIEIQQNAGIIREDDNVVDLGAAPGSWLQVIRGLTEGRVLGVDLNPIAPIEGVETIVGNFADPRAPGAREGDARGRERGRRGRLAEALGPAVVPTRPARWSSASRRSRSPARS